MHTLSPGDGTEPAQARLVCIRHDIGAGVVRIALSGTLDHASAPELDRMLRSAREQAAIVVVDVVQLRSIDAAGAAVLRHSAQHARRLVAVGGRPAGHGEAGRSAMARERELVAMLLARTQPAASPGPPLPA